MPMSMHRPIGRSRPVIPLEIDEFNIDDFSSCRPMVNTDPHRPFANVRRRDSNLVTWPAVSRFDLARDKPTCYSFAI